MQPLKITIFGDFWDCQIYMGRLYLFTFDGNLKVYNWDAIIDTLLRNEDDKLALYCGFTRGNYLYNPEFDFIFNDSDFKNLLLTKFNDLQNIKFELSLQDIDKFLYGQQENPFDDLPTDTEIYNKYLYGVTNSGIWKTQAHRYNKKYPVNTRPQHIWDCPILSLKANQYNQIALSAGNEGLFEYNPLGQDYNYDLSLKKIEKTIFKISGKHSLFSNYSFLSIYNSSNLDSSFLALFQWHKEKIADNKYERKFERIIDQSEIFNDNDQNKLSWGTQEKLYRVNNGRIEIVKFNNYVKEENEEELFSDKRIINLSSWKGEVVSGGISYFGAIIECENALVVALSDGSSYTIKGPITKWRVYPRSKNYENHLHVILEDRLEIYSFNNDYFVDQYSKDLGIFYNKKPRRYRYKNSLNYS